VIGECGRVWGRELAAAHHGCCRLREGSGGRRRGGRVSASLGATEAAAVGFWRRWQVGMLGDGI
jgi:hypothetical protein